MQHRTLLHRCIINRFCDNINMSQQHPENLEVIAANLQEVKQRMQAAHQRRRCEGREPTLLAVTKYAEPDWIEALYQLGERDFGESRPQQLASRNEHYSANNGWNDLRWHLIGQLQRNKVKAIIGKTSCIHSVNSLRLLQQIARHAADQHLPTRVLLQINISGEQAKQGFGSEGILAISKQLGSSKYFSICGLMTMAPKNQENDAIRAVFRDLRELRDKLQQQVPEQTFLSELSMGMSHDYEIAIEEGATIVRIGSELFQSCTSESNND